MTRRYRLGGWLGWVAMEGLFRTVRVHSVGRDRYQSVLRGSSPSFLICWHAFILPAVYRHRRDGLLALVSEHGDGEYLTRLMLRYGFETVRGSSTRGGTDALRALVREARRGRHLALTPDGPRGPRGVVKPGVLLAARESGAVVVPMAIGVSAGWRLSSWDGFVIPRPGSRVTVEYLDPFRVPSTASRPDLTRMAEELGALLGRRTDALNAGLDVARATCR